MNPSTPITVTLSLHDTDVVLQGLLELPGKVMLNTFFALKNQRDAILSKAVAPAEPPPEVTAEPQES